MSPAPAMESASTPATPAPARHEGGQLLISRIRFLCAMAVAGVVFWHFGWWVARPIDPEGAISLLHVRNAQIVVTMAELLGLTVVVSGLAVAICGAGAANRGPLAVAVGFATLGLRGAQMDALVLERLLSAPANQPEHAFPTFALVSETWLWIALIGVGFVVGRWVESWFTPDAGASGEQARLLPQVDFRQAAGSTAVSFAIAWIVLGFAIAPPEADIAKGQIYFAVGVAFLLATLLSVWFFEVRTAGWSLVLVGLVATIAYFFAGPDVTQEQLQARAYVNVIGLARPLPIEYAALGAIGVLLEADVMNMWCAMFGIQPPARGPRPAA